MNLKTLNIDRSWTLFLDRDGVINKRIVGDYVKNWEEFEFINGVTEALNTLETVFGRILVVTNQQGIGKGLYTESDLHTIHSNMILEVKKLGGKIDKVYFSPYLDAQKHPTRKPGIGMAHLAKEDFPVIDFSKCVMVGDSMSDMQFGRGAGMITVYISEREIEGPDIDFCFPSLLEFSRQFN